MSRPNYQRASSTNLTTRTQNRLLEGKLAIITGGSRGIGAAIASKLASQGAHLVLNYTSDSSAEKTKSLGSSLQAESGIQVLPVQADLGNANGPAHLIATAKNHFSHPKTGKFQIDIIINNAGVAGDQLLQDITTDAFHQQYNINVLGPILLLQAALPYLPNDRSGRIVNLSSVSSSLGFSGQTVYGGTKAALEHMTRTWARELAERATVNAVNPGPVATDMYSGTRVDFQQQMKPYIQNAPLMKEREGIDPDQFVKDAAKAGGRPGYDHEIAGVVAMLCSEESAWCTGSVVCANGGFKFSY
ncbi:MAG: hypothetical protein LQ350_002998 [Teloschistes chrysophthalmus]|nr:MAG: hypothetical protein LQ350_002998 [Niorma chrysophthalma]